MVVLEGIPLWLRNNVDVGIHIHNDLVLVNCHIKSVLVLISHFSFSRQSKISSSILDVCCELTSVRWVTDALEKLNAFLAFQILKSSVIRQKPLFIFCQFNLLQTKRRGCNLRFGYFLQFLRLSLVRLGRSKQCFRLVVVYINSMT